MLSLLNIATLVSATSFGQVVVNEDDLSLIRANQGNKTGPLSVWVYKNDGPGDNDFVGSLRSSDLKIKGAKTGGSKPIRWAFPADWDGDGIDEFVLIREHTKKKDHRLELRVYPTPESIFDSVDKTLARSKKADFGVAEGEGKVIAAGAIDFDGDGQDEVMTVREHVWGARFLEIRALPGGNKAQMGNPLASDLEFGGPAALEEVVSVWGSDLDGGGAEEVFVLSRTLAGLERVNVYAAPLTLFADTGAAVASFPDVTPSDGYRNYYASRIFLKDTGPVPSTGDDYIVFAQSDPTTGAQRIRVHAKPLLVGATLPPAVISDVTPGFSDPKFPIVAVYGARNNPPPPPPPPPAINGNFQVTFNGSDPGGNQVDVGPFFGVTTTVGQNNGVFEWNLTMFPGATTLICPVNGAIVDGAIISIPQASTPPPKTYYTYPVPSSIGIATLGDTVTWPGMDVGISVASNGTLTISGTDATCSPGSAPPTCGALTAADGVTVKAWISGVTFVK